MIVSYDRAELKQSFYMNVGESRNILPGYLFQQQLHGTIHFCPDVGDVILPSYVGDFVSLTGDPCLNLAMAAICASAQEILLDASCWLREWLDSYLDRQGTADALALRWQEQHPERSKNDHTVQDLAEPAQRGAYTSRHHPS